MSETDLASFLTTRLNEDEKAARIAVRIIEEQVEPHLVFSPLQVLADIDAKRRIIAQPDVAPARPPLRRPPRLRREVASVTQVCINARRHLIKDGEHKGDHDGTEAGDERTNP